MSADTSVWQRVGMTAQSYAFIWGLLQRRATARWRVLPSVFILGGTKCGSSTLTRILWQHPAHVPPLAKELMYLQQLPAFQSNYEYDPLVAFAWGRFRDGHARYCVSGYKKFFPTGLRMELRSLRGERAITSDCDPFNLYCPVAMERIAQLAVRPKFIVCLRDPVARAYSDYNMHRRDPSERRSFSQCVEQELNRIESRFRKRFINQSIYAPHLQRWFSRFAREQFLILRAEDLFADPAAAARGIFEFLNLTPIEVGDVRENAGSYDGAIDPALRMRLTEYFRPHNQRLYSLLGRNMAWG